jgi:predicted nucleic acid-binding protein
MEIIIDTSALLAVIVGEPERDIIVDITAGNSLIGPGSIPWDIGNAFSAMFKQKRLTIQEAEKGFAIFKSIPLRFVEPDFINSLKISKKTNTYAYDAYFLDCALRYNAPLLTLDKKLASMANEINIQTLEV